MATALHPPILDSSPAALNDGSMGMASNQFGRLDLYPSRLSSHSPDTRDGRAGSPSMQDATDAIRPSSMRSRSDRPMPSTPIPDEVYPGIPGDQRDYEYQQAANTPPMYLNEERRTSYAFPSTNSRSPPERYGSQPPPMGAFSDSPQEASQFRDPLYPESRYPLPTSPPATGNGQSFRESMMPYVSSSPRHPSLPAPNSSAAPSRGQPPIIPMSAAPAYTPLSMPVNVAQKPKAYAQQPTYVNPPASPTPINPVYSPSPPVQEEVCVECAMRDQDMADVDVTSPGVWERESDVLYEDLLQRELDEEAEGRFPPPEDADRPRARGDPLLASHMKIWLAINPKEPTSRQQTLNMYVKSQRALLEAEALAHARAMQESRQLDDKMRDAYSQLRRSAYDLGASHVPVDDVGGVRIKAPRSASMPSSPHVRSQSREITLLENGMIVEHVDVRKEERDERERRRREEKRERARARKTSRGSAADVLSVYSTPPPHTATVGSRYSQASIGTGRPNSVFTLDRPHIPRAQSQASFSDGQSLASPRRSRFFGRALSPWRSQDSLAPSGISGSMVDMHVAIQREEARRGKVEPSMDLSGLRDARRMYEGYPAAGYHSDQEQHTGRNPDKPIKKKKGLAKIWRIVTGGSGKQKHAEKQRSLEKHEHDDYPLAPPPPLSYLVDRGPMDRHVSSAPSLPSSSTGNYTVASPAMTISPATAPSSLIPSPISSRRSAGDRLSDGEQANKDASSDQDSTPGAEDRPRLRSSPTLPGPSSPSLDQVNYAGLRGRPSQNSHKALSSLEVPTMNSSVRPMSMVQREKSLPPLPPEARSRTTTNSGSENRPQTVFGYGQSPQYLPADGLEYPNADFRGPESRRQSFGGVSSRPQMQGQHDMRSASAARPAFDEFGNHLSVGTEESTLPGRAPKKRRSKFGLSSLLGKRSVEHEPATDSALVRSSSSDARHEGMTNAGYGPSVSTHSNPTVPRISLQSRKVLEERVDQDRDFVAYRYPSNGQAVELLR